MTDEIHTFYQNKDLDSDSAGRWRVDAKIASFSQWRVLIAITWLFVMLLVMMLAGLAWWQWGLVTAITAVCWWVYRLRRLPVVHLTQPMVQELARSPWFIYLQGSKSADSGEKALQLWQGYLTSSYVNHYLVLLNFDIIEPLPRSITVKVWRDQVSSLAWRQLQVLSRL